jgi:cytochrome c-type biogenesis protein CcmH/NrfG
VGFSAALSYLGMSVLYKKANPLWRFLIRHRLTSVAWRPLVEIARARHVLRRRNHARRMVSQSNPSLAAPGI